MAYLSYNKNGIVKRHNSKFAAKARSTFTGGKHVDKEIHYPQGRGQRRKPHNEQTSGWF